MESSPSAWTDNPAPALPVSDNTLQQCRVVVPNETEAEILTGIKVHDEASARKAASALLAKGSGSAIITLGEKGAYILDGSTGFERLIAAPKVESIDAVAAGDVFVGALAVKLGGGADMEDAVYFANHAAAISTTRNGAQPSIPRLEEVVKFMA